MSAFLYSVMRLPECMSRVSLVLMGQSEEVFSRRGYPHVDRWQPVNALARRRMMFYDGAGTLAAFIASVSDIDDLIPIITAYQIEWNKLHQRLHGARILAEMETQAGHEGQTEAVCATLGISEEDFGKLQVAWGRPSGPTCSR